MKKKLEWYVYMEDFNKREIVKYNIFDHYSFEEDVKKAYKKYKNNYDDFCAEVKQSLMYYFWSKCEWEIILTSWPERKDFNDEKIDVYDQVTMNEKVFMDYLWNALKGK